MHEMAVMGFVMESRIERCIDASTWLPSCLGINSS